MSVGYILIIWVGLLFVVFGLREVRRRKWSKPIRESQESLPIRLQIPVLFKRDTSARWALGAAGFTLVVRDGAFSVLGLAETQSWYFSAPSSTVEVGHGGKRQWIVIAGPDSDKSVRLWVRPRQRGRIREAWSALVAEGAIALTDPPVI